MERVRAFTGHVNVSNFAGMATNGDYIACGSETSQVRLLQLRLLAQTSSRDVLSGSAASRGSVVS
jgi:hypothetical protein